MIRNCGFSQSHARHKDPTKQIENIYGKLSDEGSYEKIDHCYFGKSGRKLKFIIFVVDCRGFYPQQFE